MPMAPVVVGDVWGSPPQSPPPPPPPAAPPPSPASSEGRQSAGAPSQPPSPSMTHPAGTVDPPPVAYPSPPPPSRSTAAAASLDGVVMKEESPADLPQWLEAVLSFDKELLSMGRVFADLPPWEQAAGIVGVVFVVCCCFWCCVQPCVVYARRALQPRAEHLLPLDHPRSDAQGARARSRNRTLPAMDKSASKAQGVSSLSPPPSPPSPAHPPRPIVTPDEAQAITRDAWAPLLRDLFRAGDQNGSGTMDRREFVAMAKYGSASAARSREQQG